MKVIGYGLLAPRGFRTITSLRWTTPSRGKAQLTLLEGRNVDLYGAGVAQFCLKAPRGGLQNDALLCRLDEVDHVEPTVNVYDEVGAFWLTERGRIKTQLQRKARCRT